MTKIMLVLTDYSTEDVYQSFLEDEGYEIFSPPHVHRSYAAVVALACAEQPDLILTQSQLHTLDGYEMCRQLKLELMSEHIPIIALVNYNEIEDFRLLIKHIICVPTSGGEIINAIERALEH